jgi:hypothetical protein
MMRFRASRKASSSDWGKAAIAVDAFFAKKMRSTNLVFFEVQDGDLLMVVSIADAQVARA